MTRNSYRKIFYLVILVVVVLLVMRVTSLNRGQLTPIEGAVKDALSPLQTVTMSISRGIKDAFSFVLSLGSQGAENERLREEIRVLEGKLQRLEELRVENIRLKEMLNYQEFNVDNYRLMTAGIIGRDPSNWFSTFTVNKGAVDGIARDMAVLVPEGLVGRVVAVSERTAEVLLITDPRSGVGAVVQQNRMPGVVEGVANSAGVLRMIHLPKDAPLEEGQMVVSSGVGGIYPPGIGIGEIISAENDPGGLFQIALLNPAVDFRLLEEVFIVMEVYNPEIYLPLDANDLNEALYGDEDEEDLEEEPE
ncbi:rod shape-determining protein MreC [Desulfofalx alkaliphila]|uniref:rod shape-determining protein MreC n=1 Tax=Desulfofalx alkaliphila TaxID=105483 RepID=UPI0009FE5408|nr:rod shape-determining protein MreC [Desulfofalx alkaliphila]